MIKMHTISLFLAVLVGPAALIAQGQPARYSVSTMGLPLEWQSSGLGDDGLPIPHTNSTYAPSINSSGQVAGVLLVPLVPGPNPGTFGLRTFLYDGNTLRFPANTQGIVTADGLNTQGEFAGWATNYGSDPYAVAGVGEVDPNQPNPSPCLNGQAYLYDGLLLRILGRLPGPNQNCFDASQALGINNVGQAVGWFVFDGDYSILPTKANAFIYSNATGLVNLFGSQPATTNSSANAINNSGHIVGFYTLSGSPLRRAFLRGSDGEIRDLGSLSTGDTIPYAINDSDWTVGESAVGSATHAFLYRDGQLIDLDPSQVGISRAKGINNRGQIVGAFTVKKGVFLPGYGQINQLAFVNNGNGMEDLNALIPQTSGWVLRTAHGINDAGQILAEGITENSLGQMVSHAVLLTPTNLSPCGSLISPTSQSFAASGGAGVVDVAANQGCTWTAQSNAGWIKITAFDGTGSGKVRYSVGATSPLDQRSGTLTIAGLTFTITQETALSYYGLGDSIASGHGLDGDPGTGCHQAPGGYPRLVAQELARFGVSDRGAFACSGALTSPSEGGLPLHTLGSQVHYVLADLQSAKQSSQQQAVLVSLTIGADEIPWTNPVAAGRLICAPNIEDELRPYTQLIQLNVESAIRRLLAQGSVSVVVTDYHNPFNAISPILQGWAAAVGGCSLAVLANDPLLNGQAERAIAAVNAALRQAVAAFPASQVSIASVHDLFKGHESAPPFCGVFPVFPTWVQSPFQLEPLPELFGDCFHPNPTGAGVYATAVVQTALRLLAP